MKHLFGKINYIHLKAESKLPNFIDAIPSSIKISTIFPPELSTSTFSLCFSLL